jgi:hypothetical protein
MSEIVKFVEGDTEGTGKIADAELHFFPPSSLEGMKLVGFAVWEPTKGKGRNVTFPSRPYRVGGGRRTFALLRPIVDKDPVAGNALRDFILAAYAAWEATR